MVAAVDWEEELLPPPLSLLGEGEGTVEEERTGQSSRFNGPGMDGNRGLALGRELGAGLEAIVWMLDEMSGAGKEWLLYLELVFESWRSLGLVVLLKSWWNHVAVGIKTATSTPCEWSCRGIVFHVLIMFVCCLFNRPQWGNPRGSGPHSRGRRLVIVRLLLQGCPLTSANFIRKQSLKWAGFNHILLPPHFVVGGSWSPGSVPA